MAFMQVSHGGHKGRAPEAAQLLAQVCNGVDDVHVFFLERAACGRSELKANGGIGKAKRYQAWVAFNGKLPFFTACT
jgi:hypothetical protein